MILPVHNALRARVLDVLRDRYALTEADLPPVVIDYAPTRELGDLALPLAFELAKRLRKSPRLIAQEIAGSLGTIPGVLAVEPTGTGYLNARLDRVGFLRRALESPRSDARSGESKTIVEHTAINPNKAAHIGHLRNAALGDTLVRALKFQGVPVEVQNYIDDTGVQVADVVVGFRELEGKNRQEVQRLAEGERFDYYCWDLYARVTEWYEQDKARLALRAATLHDIEHGVEPNAGVARLLADHIVRRHLETMARMNVFYDLLTWEGDILRLHFWARAFEILKEQGAVYLQNRGRLAGCWVMKIEENGGTTPEGELAAGDISGAGELSPGDVSAVHQAEMSAGVMSVDEDLEKVIVRSNGTVTYVGKDIAYQFWKFGLLGRDFHYRIFSERGNGGPLWATTDHPTAEEIASTPAFGGAHTTYNVIDVRQSYLQKLLKQALQAIGRPEEAARSVHFSYEMVALSHETARQLGYTLDAEDEARPFVEVSGRKGLGVKADDLLDTLTAKAESEVEKRNPEMAPADIRATGQAIAVAAVRYFMIRFSRGKIIAFDIDEALNFEGESGPYLQYAVVRANNIFQKLREREGLTEADVVATLGTTPAGELTGEAGHELWALVLESARLDEVVAQAVRTLEFSILAKWAFGLAQMFNGFYHKSPILNEERVEAKRWRAAAAALFRAQLTRALGIMGIQVPMRM